MATLIAVGALTYCAVSFTSAVTVRMKYSRSCGASRCRNACSPRRHRYLTTASRQFYQVFVRIRCPGAFHRARLRCIHARPSDRASSLYGLAAFASGAALGLLPLVYALTQNTDRLVSLTLKFHLTAVFDWYESQGVGRMLTLDYKVRQFARMALRDGNATLWMVFGASLTALVVKTPWSRLRRWRPSPTSLALLALFGGALVVAMTVGLYAIGVLNASRVFSTTTVLRERWRHFSPRWSWT